jgi:hypothetical protein
VGLATPGVRLGFAFLWQLSLVKRIKGLYARLARFYGLFSVLKNTMF